eukprot:6180763-Pleurochrysis_carterae.AAC.2
MHAPASDRQALPHRRVRMRPRPAASGTRTRRRAPGRQAQPAPELGQKSRRRVSASSCTTRPLGDRTGKSTRAGASRPFIVFTAPECNSFVSSGILEVAQLGNRCTHLPLEKREVIWGEGEKRGWEPALLC